MSRPYTPLEITCEIARDSLGAIPSRDVDAYLAYVEHSLTDAIVNDALVHVAIYAGSGPTRVTTSRAFDSQGRPIDDAEIASWVKTTLWQNWCRGDRAPESSP